MKRRKILLLSILVLLLLAVLAGICLSTGNKLIREGMPVIIVYDPGYGVAFEQELTPEESARVIEILASGYTSSNWGSTPSCGFDRDVAIEVGPFRFLPAMDTCNWLGCGNTLYMLNVTEKEMAEIHAIFKKYGGEFPCI